MKPVYRIVFFLLCFGLSFQLINPVLGNGLGCTPLGDQTTYGTNNVWMAYVYQGINFNTYKGYVTEGTSANQNFDESFGGAQVAYTTNGCNIYTDTFSVRYKLTRTFATGDYDFTIGGDDGFRLSLDGGVTWVLNKWVLQGYTTYTYTAHLSGTYNMVLEYYENFGSNRISFSLATACVGNGDPTVYGTNNTWQGYLYQGMNFNTYKGHVTEGNAMNMNFDESFGGNNVTYNTSNCSIVTEQFSARYRLTTVLPASTYLITVGGDDGYRLSLDGGITWVINKWQDQGYAITTYTGNLKGTYNMVLEYYENGGSNRLSFGISGSLLPVTLSNWTARPAASGKVQLNWTTEAASNFDHFQIQRSTDGVHFENIAGISGTNSNSNSERYSYTDMPNDNGVLYYRLLMIDKDGSSTYSDIQTVILKSALAVKIFPTVVDNGKVYVETGSATGTGKIALYDMNGVCLLNKTCNFNGTIEQVSLQSSGTGSMGHGSYIVSVSNASGILFKKIIIIK